MKHLIILSIIGMLLSCGGKTEQGNVPDTTLIENIDSAGIIEMANVMKRDISLRLRENDIQAVGALCQEALDHISYFHSIGENSAAGLYSKILRSFVRESDERLDEMATQNYIVKQFVTTVSSDNTGSGSKGKGQKEGKKEKGGM